MNIDIHYPPRLCLENNMKTNGLAALLIVVIVGAASLTFIVGATLIGVSEIDEAYVFIQGEHAFSAAEGCLEDTLQKLRKDAAYNGASPPVIPDGSCIITIQNSGGMKDITVQGNYKNYTNTIRAVVDLSGGVVTMLSWREL